MIVDLVVLGSLPPRLAQTVVGGLPAPFTAGKLMAIPTSLTSCYDRASGQYLADCVLARLPDPLAGRAVLGLTAVDLTLPPLAYVFGLSPVGRRRGLVSCARLRSPAVATSDDDLLARRLGTEAVHELGHAIGLVHCPVTECAMHRSLWPEAVDLKAASFCPACAAQAGALVAGVSA